MAEELDAVTRYGMTLGFAIRPRTVLVEGSTDADLFQLAARLERELTGAELLDANLAIIAAGEGDNGGTRGVIRELVSLRAVGRTCLLPDGRPRYRFIGLFDGDKAGKQAVRAARDFDTSILEFKDVFRLWPIMPRPGSLDPQDMQQAFERENAAYKGLDWELEDLLPEGFVDVFLSENAAAVVRSTPVEGKVHRDLTRDGKARLHRFVKQHAMRDDLAGVIEVLKAVRFYLRLQ